MPFPRATPPRSSLRKPVCCARAGCWVVGAGWWVQVGADQALAIYIKSSFFPASGLRVPQVRPARPITPELKSTLLAAGEPSPGADEFLFPLFAEFCFNEFAGEIRGVPQLCQQRQT